MSFTPFRGRRGNLHNAQYSADYNSYNNNEEFGGAGYGGTDNTYNEYGYEDESYSGEWEQGNGNMNAYDANWGGGQEDFAYGNNASEQPYMEQWQGGEEFYGDEFGGGVGQSWGGNNMGFNNQRGWRGNRGRGEQLQRGRGAPGERGLVKRGLGPREGRGFLDSSKKGRGIEGRGGFVKKEGRGKLGRGLFPIFGPQRGGNADRGRGGFVARGQNIQQRGMLNRGGISPVKKAAFVERGRGVVVKRGRGAMMDGGRGLLPLPRGSMVKRGRGRIIERGRGMLQRGRGDLKKSDVGGHGRWKSYQDGGNNSTWQDNEEKYMHGRNPPQYRNEYTEIPEEREWGGVGYGEDQWQEDQNWSIGDAQSNRKRPSVMESNQLRKSKIPNRGRNSAVGDYSQRYVDNYDGGYAEGFEKTQDIVETNAKEGFEGYKQEIKSLGREERYGFDIVTVTKQKNEDSWPPFGLESVIQKRSKEILVDKLFRMRVLNLNQAVLLMLKHLANCLVFQNKIEEDMKDTSQKVEDGFSKPRESGPNPSKPKDAVENEESSDDITSKPRENRQDQLISILEVTINEILESRKLEEKMKKLEQQTSSPENKEVDNPPEPSPENSKIVEHSAPSALEQMDEADKDQRLIGVVGYGCANIRLMLNSLQHLGHVVLCKNKITKSFLRLFPNLIIEAFKSDPKHDVQSYTVVLDEENEIIKITHADLPNAVVEVRLTSAKYSLTWCTDTAEENPTNGLNVDNCLSNLTLIRRTRWFDRKINKAPIKIGTIRLFLDMKIRGNGWADTPMWIIYVVVNFTSEVGNNNTVESYHHEVTAQDHQWIAGLFLRTLEVLASGVLLPNEHTILDPCEEDMTINKLLTCQQMENITCAAQRDLRYVCQGKFEEVLGCTI
ncbi:uncharacterized protein LOC100186668 isoform X2 [Ciona intestinalis]